MRGPAVKVEKINAIAGSMIGQSFTRIDYADAYRVELPPQLAGGVDEVTTAFLGTRIPLIIGLLKLRNWLVKPFGLRTTPYSPLSRAAGYSLQPGTGAGIFKVFDRSANEIVLGDNDRHLDFRLAVILEKEGDRAWAVVPTAVHFNSWLGWVYFVPVKVFHRLIVPAMLRQMVRQNPPELKG